MASKTQIVLFLIGLSISSLSNGSGFDRKGILCFEMGAEVAYYFIKGKVIRYSAFHAFVPPTELQKQLYGSYEVSGDKIRWVDRRTKVRFSYDRKKMTLAANEKWSTASTCDEVTISEIKEYFGPILERNRTNQKSPY